MSDWLQGDLKEIAEKNDPHDLFDAYTCACAERDKLQAEVEKLRRETNRCHFCGSKKLEDKGAWYCPECVYNSKP